MTTTQNLKLNKPDADDFYNINVQNENMDIIDQKVTENNETFNGVKTSIDTHITNKSNPHGVTKSQVGLSNVPNVSTNDQTPTYTVSSSNTALVSGEKLSVAFGKMAKAISSLISHLSDTVGHITSAERTKWNNKLDANATAVNADKVDGIEGTYLVYAPLTYGDQVFASVNLNTWLRTGIYGMHSSCTPVPSGTDGWGSIQVLTAMSGRIMQIAWFWNENGNPLWRRISNDDGATWSEWQKIADTRNTALVKIQSSEPSDTKALWVY